MLQRIEDILDLNGLVYSSSGHSISIKLGGIASQVKITYVPEVNKYMLSSSEGLYMISTFLLLLSVSFILLSTVNIMGTIAIGFMAVGIIMNLFTAVITQVKLLDIKAQLRDEGIYLSPRS